jgi:hypothetical protein
MVRAIAQREHGQRNVADDRVNLVDVFTQRLLDRGFVTRDSIDCTDRPAANGREMTCSRSCSAIWARSSTICI